MRAVIVFSMMLLSVFSASADGFSSQWLAKYESACVRARNAVAAKDYINVASCIDEINSLPVSELISDLPGNISQGHLFFDGKFLENLVEAGFNSSVVTFDIHINRGQSDSSEAIFLSHEVLPADSSVTFSYYGEGAMELCVIAEDDTALRVEQLDDDGVVIRCGESSAFPGCTRMIWEEAAKTIVTIRITNPSNRAISCAIASN